MCFSVRKKTKTKKNLKDLQRGSWIRETNCDVFKLRLVRMNDITDSEQNVDAMFSLQLFKGRFVVVYTVCHENYTPFGLNSV